MPPSLATPLGQGIVGIAGRFLFTDDEPGAVAYWASTHTPAVSADRAEAVIMLLQYMRWKGAQFLNEFLHVPAADAILVGIIGRLMPYCPPLSASKSTTEADFHRLGTAPQPSPSVDLDIQQKSPRSLYEEEEEGENESEEEEEEEDAYHPKEQDLDLKRSAKELNVTEDYLKKLVAADKKLKGKLKETSRPRKDAEQSSSCKAPQSVSRSKETEKSGMPLKPIPKVAPERRPTEVRYQTPLDRTIEHRQRSRDQSESRESRDRKRQTRHGSHSRSTEHEPEVHRRRQGEHRGDSQQHSGRNQNVGSRYEEDRDRRHKRSRSRSLKRGEDKRQNRRDTPPPSSSSTGAVSQSQFDQLTRMVQTLADKIDRQEKKR